MLSNLRLHDHRLTVERDLPSTLRPRFLIGDNIVALGPYLDRMEHERIVLQTVGSVDWFSTVEVDEFRFDQASGLLQSLALRVPEHSVASGEKAIEWDRVEELAGNVGLIDIENFQVAPSRYRIVDNQCNLICLREGVDAAATDLARVRVAPDLSLLFAAGDYAGWRLGNAAAALADSDDAYSPAGRDPELSDQMAEYLTLVSFPNLDLLFEGDSRIRDKLEGISGRLRGSDNVNRHRAILITQIEKLITEWYP